MDYGAWTSVARLGVFERASKAFTLSVVAAEIGETRADTLRRLKKVPLAQAAAKELDGKWLPDPIRRTAGDGVAQAAE
ncbi:MAG: hypothetical protein ACRC67_34870 [Inquilinus sp.]|uniref:hypothetical protein n=1 Tax=Inquilinus sp. TaxID=1932117 RepID=UPI003F2AAE86